MGGMGWPRWWGGAEPEGELTRRLRRASRDLRDLAREFPEPAPFWDALPSGARALEAATRLGVARGTVGAALDALAPSAASEVRVELANLARSFGEGLALDVFTRESERLCLILLDHDPAVIDARAQVAEAWRWGRFQEELLARVDLDRWLAAGHRAQADTVRRFVPIADVLAALRGDTGPYR